MLEIFLTAIILGSVGFLIYITLSTLKKLEELSKTSKNNIDVIYRYLLKIHTKDDLQFLLHSQKNVNCEFLIKTIDSLRSDIITHMGDLATKQDFCKIQDNLDEIVAVRAKMKQDRLRSMRVAFGGKEDN